MSLVRCRLVLFALPLGLSIADAQPVDRHAQDLTISAALTTALALHPRVRTAETNVVMWRGARQQAAAPFDGIVTSAASTSDVRDALPTGGASNGVSFQNARRTSYALRFDRAFRSGATLTEELSLDQTHLTGTALPGIGTGSAMLQLRVPLINNRAGGVTRSLESAAEAQLDGAYVNVRQAQAEAVLDAAAAYWSYVGAGERLQLLALTEARAAQLVDDTRQMVSADERPASDTLQVLATLSMRAAARLNAEQQLLAAREQLGLAMGLQGGPALALPSASTPFPRIPIASDMVDSAGERAATQWISIAMERRADLQSLRHTEQASALELRSAESGLRPQMDMIVGAGYTGMVQGGRSLGGFLAPLRENVAGLTSSVQLSMRLPTTNALAMGRRRVAAAALHQRGIARDDARRRVETGVTVAVSAVRQARLALRLADRAVALSAQAVENERQKFRMGVATLFDVINAEEARLNASLGLIQAQVQHATTLASLHFVTGFAVSPSGPVVIGDLTQLPPLVTP